MGTIGLFLACLTCPNRSRRGAHALDGGLQGSHVTDAVSHGHVFGGTGQLIRQSGAIVTPLKSLAAIFLSLNSKVAFVPSLSSSKRSTRRPGHASNKLLNRRIASGNRAAVMQASESAEAADDFDTLFLDLRIACTFGKQEEVASIRKKFEALERKKPVEAVRWHMNKKVREREQTVLGEKSTTNDRLAAISALKETASHPLPIARAEDTLHKLLVEADDEFIVGAVSGALWEVWRKSGNEFVDAMMLTGSELLSRGEMPAALNQFTKVVEIAPDYAEGWNQRATVLYKMGDYERCRADCKEVLKRKPRHFGCLVGLSMAYGLYGRDFLSVDQLFEALKWCRRALEVCPYQPDFRHRLSELEPKLEMKALSEKQDPLIRKAISSLTGIKEKGPEGPGAWFQSIVGGARASIESMMLDRASKDRNKDRGSDVVCDWDVHRVHDPDAEDGIYQYFFRLRYKCDSDYSVPVKSIGRFYVLEFANGEVRQLTRPTRANTNSQFYLEPGVEYKFCWQLILGRPLHGMAGGTLFQRLDLESTYERGFPNADMEVLRPLEARVVDKDGLDDLKQGRFFMLDARSSPYG